MTFRALASHPRPAGSPATGNARRQCAELLSGLGFVISERSFEYSKFTGAWLTPLAGVAIPVLATAARLGPATLPARLIEIGAVALLVVTLIYFSGQGVLDAPLLRRGGINLEATRSDEPSVWLVAHLDSKWQPLPMLVRVAGVFLLAIGIIGLLFSASALIIVWIGALPLMLSIVGERSDGALDNASGVATILEAATLIPRSAKVGVLITDAEELALAGARAWARTRTPTVALNVDSVDDDGSLVVMYSRSAPAGLISRFRRAASDHSQPFRAFRLIPGILTDSVALAEAGWETVTLSRGTIRTLHRIHTSRDSLAHMDGRGIAGAARVLAQVATELG